MQSPIIEELFMQKIIEAKNGKFQKIEDFPTIGDDRQSLKPLKQESQYEPEKRSPVKRICAGKSLIAAK